jgi:hypothetical protein
MLFELALSTTLLAGEARVSGGEIVLHVTATGASETPLPPGVGPTALVALGTGPSMVDADVGDLVRSASRYMRALAVLPTDREYEGRLDALLAERSLGLAARRPLRSSR